MPALRKTCCQNCGFQISIAVVIAKEHFKNRNRQRNALVPTGGGSPPAFVVLVRPPKEKPKAVDQAEHPSSWGCDSRRRTHNRH
jgi:hypothetical protein